MFSEKKHIYSRFIFRATASAMAVSGMAAGVVPAFGASNDITISNGGLSVTFNLSWGAVVTSIANTNVANGLSIVYSAGVGANLQIDQFLTQNIGGSQQLMINPTQAGAAGNQPYYQHPNGSSFPQVGSPVVRWSASANHFHAVIEPLDYDTGNPSDWVYVENVDINSHGVANFSYTSYDYHPGTYSMSTEIPVLFTDNRTDAFMYPTANGSPQMVSGYPLWPQPVISNGWIGNVDTQDNLGIFYTTPVGLPEGYGTLPGEDVFNGLSLGVTHAVGSGTAYPGETLSSQFSVVVAPPQNGPVLISKQAPALFVARSSMIANGVFSLNAAAYTASPGYSLGGNPGAPSGWISSGGNTGVNGPDTGFYGTSNYQPFAPKSTAGVSDFSFLQGKGAFISQTVATTTGQSYTLAFDAAQRSGDTTAVLEVILKNAINGSQIITYTPAITDAGFAPFFLNFTANAGSTNIEFLNNSPAAIDNTVDVSNVSLTAVPEPNALSLLTIGGMALVLVGRRHKTWA